MIPRASLNSSKKPKSMGSETKTLKIAYDKKRSMRPRLAGQYARDTPRFGASTELKRMLIERMSRREISNPREVPRYHSRLTKFTSTRSIRGARKTSNTKKRSRMRFEKLARIMPPKAAAGMTVSPNSSLLPISIKENIRAVDAGPARPHALEYAIALGIVARAQLSIAP